MLFGPVAAYNVAALLLPALSAWTAYLLCRYLTGSIWAAVVGGYLFGFSTAFLRQQLLGHLHVTAVFLLPLIALVLVQYVRGELSRARPRVAARRCCSALQLWISSELALTLTLFLALGLAARVLALPRPAAAPALVAHADRRRRTRSARVVAAPILVYTLIGFGGGSGSFVDVRGSGTDLLNFVCPDAHDRDRRLVVHVAALPAGRRERLPRTADAADRRRCSRCAPAARPARGSSSRCSRSRSLITLGTTLQVDGHDVVALPWSARRPRARAQQRLSVPLRRLRLARGRGDRRDLDGTTKGWIFPRPYVLPVLAVAALVPAVWRTTSPTFHPSHPERVAFFSEGLVQEVPRAATRRWRSSRSGSRATRCSGRPRPASASGWPRTAC